MPITRFRLEGQKPCPLRVGRIASWLAIFVLMMVAAGCERDERDEGLGERIGRQVDDSVDKSKDAVEEAAEKTKDWAEDTKDDIERKLDE